MKKMIPRGLGTNFALHELGGWEHCHLEKSRIHQENRNLSTLSTPRSLNCPRKPALSERCMKDPKLHGLPVSF